MSSLISDEQSNFVPGRQIVDNILIVQEVIHSLRTLKGEESMFVIKVDLKRPMIDSIGISFWILFMLLASPMISFALLRTLFALSNLKCYGMVPLLTNLHQLVEFVKGILFLLTSLLFVLIDSLILLQMLCWVGNGVPLLLATALLSLTFSLLMT